MPVADSSSLNFKQWGLLAIQDGGRRKPVDTFAREALIKITGRSTYTSSGKKWQGTDFVLSMLLDTHDWKGQPMILVSLGELKQKLELPEQQRRFSFPLPFPNMTPCCGCSSDCSRSYCSQAPAQSRQRQSRWWAGG